MTKKKLLVSFSGGETSAYMAQWLWKNKQDEYEMIFVFANTGEENEETLKFVQLCSNFFDFTTVWVESAPRVIVDGEVAEMNTSVYSGEWVGGRVGTTFKIVNYQTASRDGQPFERVIQKYGIPNMATPHCTRELKQHPIQAYAKSIGWKDYYTAIGIRYDELDRMNRNWKKKKLIYPLLENGHRMTKPMINAWWASQPFRLELKGYQGNCKTCWKKSDHKLFAIAKEQPENFLFFDKMEARYGDYIPESRVELMNKRNEQVIYKTTFFRKNRSVQDIIKESETYNGIVEDDMLNYDLIGGESCEVFATCESEDKILEEE